MELVRWIRHPRKRFVKLLKRRGRRARNAFLARHSLVGDPEVFERADFSWVPEIEEVLRLSP